MRLIRNRSGFTLIEALVVVSILGVVATFAVPAVERTLLANKLDRATMVMASDLQQAFALASRQRKPVWANVDAGGTYFVVRDRATNAIMHERYYGQGLSPFGLTGLSISNSFVVFPNGIASASANVTLTLGAHQRRITMSRVGQIRIQVL